MGICVRVSGQGSEWVWVFVGRALGLFLACWGVVFFAVSCIFWGGWGSFLSLQFYGGTWWSTCRRGRAYDLGRRFGGFAVFLRYGVICGGFILFR